jgi:superfamily II DNA or RNA helicase
MHPSLSILLDEPSLVRAITAPDLSGWFPHEAIRRARSYVSPGTITNLRAKPSTHGDIMVEASVQGTKRTPYRVTLDFYADGITGGWQMEPLCTCPVGFKCKHAAAATMRLAAVIRESGQPAGQERTSLPRHVEQWLRSLQDASEAPAVKPRPRGSNPKFLAFCIETPAYRESGLQFALHPATRSKSGDVLIEPQAAQADPTRPTKYMVDEDLPAVVIYQQMLRKQRGWGHVRLEGEDAARLLGLALATGRLFFGYERVDYRSSSEYLLVSPGDPVEVSPGWETEASGASRPVLEGLPAGFLLVRSIPRYYLDPASGRLGVLTSHVSDGVLDLWQNGPVVPPESARFLTERLRSIKTPGLPAPVKIEDELRPDMPPAAAIHVRRETLLIHGDPIDFIFGIATFQYGDSTPFPAIPGSPTSRAHAEIRDGKRIVWNRNPKAEQRLVLHLENSGLVLISDLISQGAVPPGYESAYVTDDPRPTPVLSWMRWLEHEAPLLRNDGWIITVDPEAGLTAHDVGDFLPAIEVETDHGIDWFRFDVSFEVDGVKRSLIPLIAQAIEKNFPPSTTPDLPEWITIPCEDPEDGFIRLPARRFLEIVDQVRHLFHGREPGAGGFVLDRLAAAGIADNFGLRSSSTMRALADLGRTLKDIRGLPQENVPLSVNATLRPYQHEGFRWLRFLTKHHLNGILADDMGLGKTLQTLAHLAAEHAEKPGKPSLVVAPTSVVPNWASESARFTPGLKLLTLHGADRLSAFKDIRSADLVVTSYPLLHRDIGVLAKTDWHCVILDEAQHIKNPKSITAQAACTLTAAHRLCLSGTPMENHLGELWSLMRFLMPGYLPDEKTFNSVIRKPIERDRSGDAQTALNRRVSPLILRRTKDQVATDLPPKTELIHHVELTKKQVDLYESVRASMDKRVREAIAAKGLAKSHIIVLDALLKLRQICCHPTLLKTPAAEKVTESAKLHFLTEDLLPQLLEEGRRILLFSQFTSMLALIEAHLEKQAIPFLKLTGESKDRASLVKRFQSGEVPVFLISLKAGGTGLNLTAADTVIHYDPWWNPAAENQATDRAHRIGQNKPVFVHKLVCRGSIEDRILELQKHKSALVKALLSEETTSLRIDPETLSHLLEPIA